MTEKVKAAMQYIRRVQRTEPQKWINNDSVPIDLEGSMEIPSIPERKYVVEYLEEKHVENEVLYAHLFDHLCNFLEVLQARDFDKLATMGETNFVNKLKASTEAQSDSFKFTRGEYSPEKVNCIDKLFIRGVGVDRTTNDNQMDYTKVISLEKYGLRQFIHKYDLGMQDYYFKRRYEAEIAKKLDLDWYMANPEEAYVIERELREGQHQMRQEMKSKQLRYVFRVMLQLKDGSIGKFDADIDGQRKKRGLMADKYPNAKNNIAIFECQLKVPPMLSMLNHTHKEFLMATTLNFKNWKLVDCDNYMKGNKPFTSPGDEGEQIEWQKKFKEFQEVWHPEKTQKLEPPTKRQKEALRQQVKDSLTWLDEKEPNSNANMPLIKMREINNAAKADAAKNKKSKKDKKAEAQPELVEATTEAPQATAEQ